MDGVEGLEGSRSRRSQVVPPRLAGFGNAIVFEGVLRRGKLRTLTFQLFNPSTNEDEMRLPANNANKR